jgi:4-diphosphocytidyl-2-C-methyl-D-erythritol kinase
LILALPARAKLNLELEVIARTNDGFHDVRTTIQAVDLHDLLEMSPAANTGLEASGLQLSRLTSGGGAIADNSVLKAHSALEQAARKMLPTRFHLHKRIPPGSGLGGGSSDAAAALRGLKAMYALDVDLLPIAEAIGADVPFFIAGGTARAEGRGERLTRIPTTPAWFAIAWPRIELSTAAVYKAWDETGGEGPNHLRRAAEHADPRIVDFARRLAADPGWQMTGSGSAFFRRCNDDEEARRVTASLDCWTAVTHAVGPWG